MHTVIGSPHNTGRAAAAASATIFPFRLSSKAIDQAKHLGKARGVFCAEIPELRLRTPKTSDLEIKI
jgi:hypothetical protein